MKIIFEIRQKYEAGYALLIVGNIKELGDWDTSKGLLLQFVGQDKWSAELSTHNEDQRKFEFKIVKRFYNGKIEWETLPENKNRRWKFGESVKIMMEWSNPKGNRLALKKHSIKLNKGPSIVIDGPVTKQKKTGRFNPYLDAEDSDEEPRKKDNIKSSVNFYDPKQFESIFYRLPKQKLNLCRMNSKLHTIFVVSRKGPENSEFSQQIRDYLQNLKCRVCWLHEGAKTNQQANSMIKFTLVNETNEVLKEEEMLSKYQQRLGQILPNSSICLVLDVSLARLSLPYSLNGLLLGALTKEQMTTLQKLNLDCFQFISFTHAKNTKQFIESIAYTEDQSEGHKQIRTMIEQKMSLNIKEEGRDALQMLLHEMRQFLQNMRPSQMQVPPKADLVKIQKQLSEHQSQLIVIDLRVIEKMHNPNIMIEKLKRVSKQPGKCVIILASIDQKEISTRFPSLINQTIILIVSDGLFVKLNNTWVDVLQKHQRNIQIIQSKFKEYLTNYGGTREHSVQSLSYINADNKIIEKVFAECRDMLTDEKYLRVSSTEDSVRVSWRLKERRVTLETVVQIRCMVDGSLGCLCVILSDLKKDCIFDDMDNLIRAFPSFFKQYVQRIYLINDERESEYAQGYLTSKDLEKFQFGLM